jgi:hypothetical protein
MAQEEVGGAYYDFMYGKLLLRELFDINRHEHDYLEHAYNIWRDIGNIAKAIHSFEFTVPQDGKVMLPCNMEFIEAVSRGNRFFDECGEQVEVLVVDKPIGNNQFFADAVIRNASQQGSYKTQKSHLHPGGEFVPYELGGSTGNNFLIFDNKFAGDTLVCIYRGIVIDKDGNPLLNRKEAEAIAYRMAFLDTQKKAFMRDPASIQMLSYIKDEAGKKMAAAKIPEHISQNQWNRILSAMTRHDRKVFNSSYKTMQ